MEKYVIEYGNDTGPTDDFFIEWWDVSNGNRSFRCNSKSDAEWLCNLLNSISDDQANVNV